VIAVPITLSLADCIDFNQLIYSRKLFYWLRRRMMAADISSSPWSMPAVTQAFLPPSRPLAQWWALSEWHQAASMSVLRRAAALLRLRGMAAGSH